MNWCELTTTGQDDKVIYHNAFATNHPIGSEIVRVGRTRWKVQNENRIKIKGYHFTHRFGHGKQHICALLETRNLLAFLFYTLLEVLDLRYPTIRQFLRLSQPQSHRFPPPIENCLWPA